jgi:hypothetical protein
MILGTNIRWSFGLSVVLTVCLLAGDLLASTVLQRIYRRWNPYLDQTIAGPTTLASKWLQIEPQQPLQIRRQRQRIVLDVGPLQWKDGEDIEQQLVSMAQVQIQLIGEDGLTYEFDHPSFLRADSGEYLIQFSPDYLPKGQKYYKVRLRADSPFQYRRIFWRNYDRRDVERIF